MSEHGRRPNIVLITGDQLRADHLGFGGNTVVRTPHLDAIAERGTVFDRGYVANPVCMPNRSSLLTARVPSSHGTRFNGIPLDHDADTFVRRLRDAGYRTGLVGKAHLQNIGHHPKVAAGHRREVFGSAAAGDVLDRRWPAGWDQYENLERHRAGWVEMPEDFYGFEHVELAIDHADYCGGHYEHWLRDRGFDPAQRGENAALEVSSSWRQVYRPAMPEELYPTAWVGERSGDFIREAAGEPFFLHMSFPDPHHPFTPPGRYYDMYDPAELELPETFWADHTRSMPHLRQWSRKRGEQPSKMMPFAATEEQFREALAKQYGAITFIDDVVGRIVAELEERGELENTVFVITSDHGDMFGDQGVMLKMAMHYEGPIRVPYVLSGPGCASARSDAFASTLDIGPTLLDLAGADPMPGVHGRSQVAVLTDAEASVRDEVYIEEDEMFDAIGAGVPLRMRTLVTDSGRISVYEGSELGELFLHDTDPRETDNRWQDPDAAADKGEFLVRLVQAQMAHSDICRVPSAMA